MAASIGSGRSRCLLLCALPIHFVPGCALVVAAVCASCEASTGPTEAVATSSSALAVTGLFATGVDAAGARLAIGTIDPHYVLSSNDANFPGPDALTVNPAGGWAGAGANSRSISVEASTTGAMGGVYTYTTTFTLAGVDPTTATLSGQWACDDSCVLELNGTQVASKPTPAWTLVENFTVPAGSPFQLGVNTLAFVTSNTTGGPTGLQVVSNQRQRLGLQRRRPVLDHAVLQHAVGDLRVEVGERRADPERDRPHPAAHGDLHGRRRHRGVHVGGSAIRGTTTAAWPTATGRATRRTAQPCAGRARAAWRARANRRAAATPMGTALAATGATKRRTRAPPSSRTACQSRRTRRTLRRR